jgi:hypothetical protein
MSQTTLNNGVNALTYFHQLVKVISEDGVIYTPKGGVVGMGTAPGTYQDPMLDANPSVAENK